MRFERLVNACKHPFTEYQVTKAKQKYRKKHPLCSVCGIKPTFFGRNNDVHHIVPVHISFKQGKPELAVDRFNLRTTCRLCHWWIGHLGNWKDCNENFDETAEKIRQTFYKYGKSYLEAKDGE